MKDEENYINWKNLSCPSFDKPQLTDKLTLKRKRFQGYKVPELLEGSYLGNEELTRLWKASCFLELSMLFSCYTRNNA
jgi:hypothetical protein